jgi:predicted dienelactone hydrolase
MAAIVALLLFGAGPLAAAASVPSVPCADAPELATLGRWKVGVVRDTVNAGRQPFVMENGTVQYRDRLLKIRVWYPAGRDATGPRTTYHHVLHGNNGVIFTLNTPGIAISNAPPARGRRFPLVVISHGFGGWDTSMTFLTENLASKGFVVAAIDHADPAFQNVPTFFRAMKNVIAHRAVDQEAVIGAMIRRSRRKNATYGPLIDSHRIALVGYSMGGFGALGTLGAGYDPDSPLFKRLPPQLAAYVSKSNIAVAKRIDAAILMAPWGAQPKQRAWSIRDLARITTPILMIDGSEDHVAHYRSGVRWLFKNMTHSSRFLLVFQNAGHNIADNAPSTQVLSSRQLTQYLADPVWRGSRIDGIDDHFITAFLDLKLKGEASMKRFLDVPTLVADQGSWPQAFGALNGPYFAGKGQPRYWRGFERGTAIGLELYARKSLR